MKEKDRIAAILEILEETYPNAVTALEYKTPYQLLVATILSAQCTDVRVNIITKGLFKKAGTPQKMAKLTLEELEEEIRTCGLFHAKAKNILATTHLLLEKYKGEVPPDREKLEELPGVGRKTANVVISNAFGIPAIAVDTHVFRVANRLGLAKAKTPFETEKQLMKVIPKPRWSEAHHWLILHGRAICKAQRPLCERCPVNGLCPYYQNILKGRKKPA